MSDFTSVYTLETTWVDIDLAGGKLSFASHELGAVRNYMRGTELRNPNDKLLFTVRKWTTGRGTVEVIEEYFTKPKGAKTS